jgi:aryl-alcohol dehydrogenase-like predicted oxidoreductase
MQESGRASPVRLGFGCVSLGSVGAGRSWRADVRLVQHAIDRGITLFDTADAYGNGVSERIIGRAVRDRRDSVTISTKVGYVFDERSLVGQTARRRALPAVRTARHLLDRVRANTTHSGSGGNAGDGAYSGGEQRQAYGHHDLSMPSIRRAVEASLTRLGTDHIDVLQLHGPRSVIPELAASASELIVAGKVRRLGIGAESVASAADWVGVDGIDVVQLPYGVLDPQAEVVLDRWPDDRSVEFWARGVLGGGLLSAAVRDSGSIAHDPKLPLINDLRELGEQIGASVLHIAFDYVRANPSISTILLGIHSDEHLEANLAILDRPTIAQVDLDRARAIVSRWLADGVAP